MLGCCSIVAWCILSAIMLLIADSCYSGFACHLQTVHPFPVIFISISTEIISSFQWHAWFAKLLPCSSFSFQSTHKHCISHLAYHAMYCIMLLLHCTVIYCGSIDCVLVVGRAGRRVRERGTCWVRLRGSSFRQLWEPCKQDDHTLEITSIFALLVVRSIAMLRYLPFALSCLPYCHVKPLTILFLANHCLAKLPLLLSPSYSIGSCRWSWSWSHVGTWIFWNITISLI